MKVKFQSRAGKKEKPILTKRGRPYLPQRIGRKPTVAFAVSGAVPAPRIHNRHPYGVWLDGVRMSQEQAHGILVYEWARAHYDMDQYDPDY